MFSHWCCRWYAGGAAAVASFLAMADGKFDHGGGGGGSGGPAAAAAAAVVAMDDNRRQKRPATRVLAVA
jgi:hypothetical protein